MSYINIPIGEYTKVKRRNSLGKVYYKYVFILDFNFAWFTGLNKED